MTHLKHLDKKKKNHKTNNNVETGLTLKDKHKYLNRKINIAEEEPSVDSHSQAI